MTSKLMLQIAMGVLGVIPIVTALPEIYRGLPASFIAAGDENAGRDSDYRYWAAIWVAMGAGLYLLLPRIESETLMSRTIMGGIIFGGLSRLFGAVQRKYPLKGRLRGALFIELVIIPALVVWQSLVASGK